MSDDNPPNNSADTSISSDEPTTLFEGCRVGILGWDTDDEEEAKTFGKGVMALLLNLSQHIDLSRLEQVLIAQDYHGALAEIDLGQGVPLAPPTHNEYGTGAAMTVPVLRDDEPWSVVVIWTPLVRQLLAPDDELHNLALHTLVHELAHVEDQLIFATTYPGGWRAAEPTDRRLAALISMVTPCQSEYSAQRRSAAIAPEHGLSLLSMLQDALADVDEQIRTARREYRDHGDMDTFWPIVKERLSFLFQAIGYGIGHADWIENNRDDHSELAHQYRERLDEIVEMPNGWVINACRDAVQPFFLLDEWTDLEIYTPLVEIAEQLLNDYGMYTRPEAGAMYVDMPHSGPHDL